MFLQKTFFDIFPRGRELSLSLMWLLVGFFLLLFSDQGQRNFLSALETSLLNTNSVTNFLSEKIVHLSLSRLIFLLELYYWLIGPHIMYLLD